MSKTIAITAVAVGCGPAVDDEERTRGTLEYEMPSARFYRLDRRVDMVDVDPRMDSSGCGFLTDRAYGELVGALDGLDPTAEYEWSECEYPPEASVHLEGFTHSPFPCSWYCCHRELLRIAVVYLAVGSNVDGQRPNIDGEPYVALEPDVPCPE